MSLNALTTGAGEVTTRRGVVRLSRGTFAFALALGLVCSGFVRGGEFNRVLSIGDEAPRWEPLPAVDGKEIGTSEFSQAPVTVVVFTCNTCPYAVDVEQRLVALDAWLRERQGRLVAINVNAVEGDKLEAMKERAKEVGFEFPYLRDDSQELATKFGATTTPEFFVLDQEWKVAYMGALDDSPDGKSVTTKHVENAVASVLAGDAVAEAETVPIGCRIRFQRRRR